MKETDINKIFFPSVLTSGYFGFPAFEMASFLIIYSIPKLAIFKSLLVSLLLFV